MKLPHTLDIQLNIDAFRVPLKVPRDLLEGNTPVSNDLFKRRVMLEKMEHMIEVFRMVFRGMTPQNDAVTFEQLRNEVEEHGAWVKAQLVLLDAAGKE